MRTPVPFNRARAARGFTLVELLVVIAIITVLLALLVPALDKAVYQATLAICAGQIRTHITGVQQYAFDHKRYFPDRKAYQSDLNAPTILKSRNNNTLEWHDDRPMLKEYMAINLHLDPLAGKVDLEGDEEFTAVYSSYALFYDWGYTNQQVGTQHSSRLGQPFEFEGQKFNVLLSDQDFVSVNNNWSQSSHPDKSDVMTLQEWRNWESVGVGASQAGAFVLISTHWLYRNPNAPRRRGLIDVNHGFQDGSVTRYNDVPNDAERGSPPYGGGLVRIAVGRRDGPGYADGTAYWQVPRR
jgi:prepilin-type N-terminal cleavage/methylation domain-containing protein